MATPTPRRALTDVKNSLLGSAIKQTGKDSILKFGTGTPRRGFGDSKELASSINDIQMKKTLKPKLIDFEEEIELNSKTPAKNLVDEDYPPIESCSCNHDHRTEKYTLLESDPQFEVIEVDAPIPDELLDYYAKTENAITSWKDFLVNNNLI